MKYFVYSICILLLSCSDVKLEYTLPDFPVTQGLKSKQISQGMIMYVPLGMFVSGDFIYVLAPVDGRCLQVYNKHTGEFVAGRITIGQGPGEVVSSVMMDYDTQNNVLAVYDQAQRKQVFFRVEDDSKLTYLKDSNMNMALWGLHGVVRSAWPLSENSVLVNGQVDSIPGVNGIKKRFQYIA